MLAGRIQFPVGCWAEGFTYPVPQLSSRAAESFARLSVSGWAARGGEEPSGGPGLEVAASLLPGFQRPELSHLAHLSGGGDVGEAQKCGVRRERTDTQVNSPPTSAPRRSSRNRA